VELLMIYRERIQLSLIPLMVVPGTAGGAGATCRRKELAVMAGVCARRRALPEAAA